MTTPNKPRIEIEEMYQLFQEANPAFIPNRTNVGRFARTIGYKIAKQQINKVPVYFYIKDTSMPISK